MTTTDTGANATLSGAVSEDSANNNAKTGSVNRPKHYVQHFPQQTPQKVNNVSTTIDERDKASFYRDLYHFHEIKGTPIPRAPRVNGHEIDLHKFYSLVCSRGGWSKINYRNEWEDLVPEFDLPSKCVNASVALKQIYIRFLDRYEKIHFLGEDNDRIADENDEDNRHKKWNNKNFNEVPLKYNYSQHNVAESVRATHKLSTDLYKSSEYDRLLMSLMSSLPNEQDFAVNVCTLMANETRHTLKIEHCPKLLDALLGHAGVYSHHSMRDLFFEYYTNVRKHSLQSFWTDCLHDKPEILELTYEDYFESNDNAASSISGRPPFRLRNNECDVFEDGLNTRANEIGDLASVDFLNVKRGLGTHDYIGQRVHQITTICRNLSFFDENLPILVKNRSFLRFLVMCANIRWGNLHQMGLDTLGNIAVELVLCDPVSDTLTKNLLKTISEGLESPDRGVVIGCLEILYKLCQNTANEDHLHRYLEKRVYRQICTYLSLNDIMLLLYTLECLFALSSMGENACFAIVQVNGVIDTLVSLISVEAQSYGPDGCILMRVVETVPTHLAAQQQQTYQTNTQAIQSTHIQLQPYSPHPNQSPVPTSPSQLTHIQKPVDLGSKLLESPQHTMPVLHTSTAIGMQTTAEPVSVIQQSPMQVAAQPNVQSNFQHTPIIQQSPSSMSVTRTQIQSPLANRMDRSPMMMNETKPNIINVNTSNAMIVQTITSTAPIVTTATPPLLNNANVVYSEQQTTTIHTSASNQNSNKHAQDQENEQFALAWLRATFEPISALTSRIEQQDLYKMYLTACSKIGRTGVVSNYHFPRCVRNVFGGTVGPNQIKIKQNAMEISSFFYEGIRIRAQPLAVVHKGTILQAAVTTTTIKGPDNNFNKKDHGPKIMQNQIKTNYNQATNASAAPILQHVLSNNQTTTMAGNALSQTSPTTMYTTSIKRQVTPMPISSTSPIIASTSTTASSSSSSLIKAILANKTLTADGTIIGTPTITASINPSITTATTNVNVHQVAQRQHLQKQREAQLAAASATNSCVNMNLNKDAKATIMIKSPNIQSASGVKSSLTGNTNLMQGTMMDNKKDGNWDPVPPLAPLSGTNNLRQTSIIASIPSATIDDDSNSTNQSASSSIFSTNPTTPSCHDESEGAFAGFEGLIIPGHIKIDDDGKDHVVGTQSHVVTANKMLADLLDRKSSDPPFNLSGDNLCNKRKIDANANATFDEPITKRLITTDIGDMIDDHSLKNIPNITVASVSMPTVISSTSNVLTTNAVPHSQTTTSNAANLYAKLAASLLEDEDMDIDETITTQTAPVTTPSPIIQQQTIMAQSSANSHQVDTKPVITLPMQRQIIMSPNNAGQMILAPGGTNQSIGQPTATIKTESGYQTVILQQPNQAGNIQIQKQMIQPVIQQQQTQYVLATNQQGQTYLVAQPQQQSVNQILLQTSQQQGGTPTKTIIILQQQAPSNTPSNHHQLLGSVSSAGTPQKVIMTTQQGQQMIVTQVPRPVQHHVIMNQSGGMIPSSNANNSGYSVQSGTINTNSTTQMVSQMHQQPQISIGRTTITQHPINSMAQTTTTQTTYTTGDKKKVFVTGSGNIEVTQLSQPISHTHNVMPIINQPVSQITVTSQSMPKPPMPTQSNVTSRLADTPPTPVMLSTQQSPSMQIKQNMIQQPQMTAPPMMAKPAEDDDINWLFVCDWRGCQRKFKTANEVYLHACQEHCPDNIDPNADIYCQWGPGPNLCDNLPRKRFSLMTHINDRHITMDSFRTSVQRRIAAGPQTNVTQAVTIIKKPVPASSLAEVGATSPTLSPTATSSAGNGGSSAAMQAIKRHSMDLINPRELMDENEGPVTKSIRLTASLILRNLVNYTTTAKRCLRFYEPHLSGIALSNVESSRTIAQLLYEMNETRPY